MKVPPSTVIRVANLPSLVFPGKNKVGYFLDRPCMHLRKTKTLPPLLKREIISKCIFNPACFSLFAAIVRDSSYI
jgi:hypothetical protein